MSITQYDVTVIGGGIVGLATAYKLNTHHPNLRVLLLEKEKSVAFYLDLQKEGVYLLKKSPKLEMALIGG